LSNHRLEELKNQMLSFERSAREARKEYEEYKAKCILAKELNDKGEIYRPNYVIGGVE